MKGESHSHFVAHDVLARHELRWDAEAVDMTIGVQPIGSSPFVASRLASLVDLEPHRTGHRRFENEF